MNKRKIKQKKQYTHLVEEVKIPDENIVEIAESLKGKFSSERRSRKLAPVKEVLTLLGGGSLLAFSLVTPASALILNDLLKLKQQKENEEWKRFNSTYLKRTILRLEKQRLVKFFEKNNQAVVQITDRGKKRILKYALDEIELKKPLVWNGKWYFVSYDIPRQKSWLREIMRKFLERLGFYRFHESLYIHAYPCENEINFIREYLGVSEYVKFLIVNDIENDEAFREYFGV